jgi:hypothetical protein
VTKAPRETLALKAHRALKVKQAPKELLVLPELQAKMVRTVHKALRGPLGVMERTVYPAPMVATEPTVCPLRT